MLNELRETIQAGELATRQKAYSDRDLFEIVHREVSSKEAPGLSTGFLSDWPEGQSASLDDPTGGIRRGHVWAFGAPTNWGKSSWLLALADRRATVHEQPVLYVTCEDAPEVLASRLASRRLNIPGTKIRDRDLTPEHRGSRLVAIDDVGLERDVVALQEQLQHRYENKLATVATSGRSRQEPIARIGAQHVHRITEQFAGSKVFFSDGFTHIPTPDPITGQEAYNQGAKRVAT